MALPTTFAGQTQSTGQQLDQNFSAVGVLTVIPCTVAGTNSLTLTQNSNTPTITAYADYLRLSGVVATTNTGAVTLALGALAALNCYKDSPSGPVALSGGELIGGNMFTAIYDSTLNGGNGGFHLYTMTAFSGGTITGNMVLSGATLSVLGGSIGATLASSLLSGNSLTVAALSFRAVVGSVGVTLNSTLLTGNSLTVQGSLASVAGLQVGSVSATTVTMIRLLSSLATLAYTVTPANSTQDQSFAMAGVQVRDSMSLGMGTAVPAGAGFMGFISAAGTVTVRLTNPATVSLSAATVTLRVTAQGFA